MMVSTDVRSRLTGLSRVPPGRWLAQYRAAWLPHDVVAGVTLAAYAIPVSLAYAGLAGLPPQVGIYGYLLGGLGYALLGSSRQLAIGPTSTISLSVLVKLISDSILVGFKAGAGLTIAMTQLPSLFGVAGGGHNFFDRTFVLAGQLGQIHHVVLLVGAVAIGLLVLGERLLPGK